MIHGHTLALAANRKRVTGGAATVTLDALPSTLGGAVGNNATRPHFVRLKGPNADKYMTGPILDTGDAVARIYDSLTGTLLETQTVRTPGAKDDHDCVAAVAWPDGSLDVMASGHNSIATVQIGTRDPAGAWTMSNISWPDITTYPSMFIDSTGKAHCIIRCGNLDWWVKTKASPGAAWSGAVKLLTSADQSYTSPCQIGDEIIMSARLNNSDPGAGPIRLFAYNMLTGECRDANGGLGFISGAASSDTSKVLPVLLTDLPTFEAKPSGRIVNVGDMDAEYMVITDAAETSGLYDNHLRVYKYKGTGNRLDPASYDMGPNFHNQKGKMSSTSNYMLGVQLAREPHTGLRLYATSACAGRFWRLRQWQASDHMSLASYRCKTLRVKTDGPVMARAAICTGATAEQPVMIGEFSSFTDFNNYGTSSAVFVEPWRNGSWPVIAPGYTMRTETQAWIARMSVQPNEYWAKFIYDPFVGALIDAGIFALKDFEYFLSAHDKQASLLNIVSSSYDLTQGLANGQFKAGIGWTGDGVNVLDTGFNPSTAPGKKQSQNSCHVSLRFTGPGAAYRGEPDWSTSDNDDFGNARTLVRARTTTPQSLVRVNQTADTVQSNSQQAAHALVTNRSGSANLSNNMGGSSAGFIPSSSAPTSANIYLLGSNGGTRSTRTMAQAGMGSSLDATRIAAMVAAYAAAENAILEYLGPTP